MITSKMSYDFDVCNKGYLNLLETMPIQTLKDLLYGPGLVVVLVY